LGGGGFRFGSHLEKMQPGGQAGEDHLFPWAIFVGNNIEQCLYLISSGSYIFVIHIFIYMRYVDLGICYISYVCN